MDRRGVGFDKEDVVTSYLLSHGIEIIDRNFLTRHGEIDIVGRDGEYLVFFEVKYRKSDVYGHPLEAINVRKQKNIIKASKVYMYLHNISPDTYIRFDVVGVLDSNIEWIKNAF